MTSIPKIRIQFSLKASSGIGLDFGALFLSKKDLVKPEPFISVLVHLSIITTVVSLDWF